MHLSPEYYYSDVLLRKQEQKCCFRVFLCFGLQMTALYNAVWKIEHFRTDVCLFYLNFSIIMFVSRQLKAF